MTDKTIAATTGRYEDAEYVQLVKATVCPPSTTDNEFRLFLAQCKRSGLDPLIQQAFCVPRSAKEGDKWITKHVFQPAESGMLARAEDFEDFDGVTGGAVYEKDKCEVDAGAGTVHHKFNPCAPRGELLGAWARLARKGKLATVVFLTVGSRVQTKQDGKPVSQWAKDPAGMIFKCARAAVLRVGYPAPFGGFYISGEMPEEGHEQEARPAAIQKAKEAPALQAPAEAEVVDAETGEVSTSPAYNDLADDEKKKYWVDMFTKASTVTELELYSSSLASLELETSVVRTDAGVRSAYGKAAARFTQKKKG